MSFTLDSKLCRELGDHVETLTHSGQKTLDVNTLKKIKEICKSADGYVEHTYHLLRHQLEVDHAEVRFSAFQIIDELFRRSHVFRELLVSDMQRVIELTTGTSSNHLLPPPKFAANNLKHLSLRRIHEWNTKFGEGYKKLQLGYNFLKKCKKVDFTTLEIQGSAEQSTMEERQRKLQFLNKEKLRKVLADYEDSQTEIRNAITAMENCIMLLVPSLEDFFITNDHIIENKECNEVGIEASEPQNNNSAEESEEEADESNIRAHGMLNSNFCVKVEVNSAVQVKETPENTTIFDNVRDLHRVIQKRYIPKVRQWIKVITECADNADDVKKMVDLKEALEKSLLKCSSLNICKKADNSSDTSDSEFEEVPQKEGYEESVQEYIHEPTTKCKAASGTNEKTWNIFSQENNIKDPTTLESTLRTLGTEKVVKPCKTESITTETKNVVKEVKAAPSAHSFEPVPSTSKEEPKFLSRKEKLLAVAPKLPFDVDLYHWEEENLKAPTMLLVKPDGARFWSATSTDEMEEIAVPEGSASLRTRVIEFSGQEEAVKWACRAPLPSGALCPRRDRFKCPFHGRIVARDSTGKCSNAEDEKRLKEELEEHQKKYPDWQDPVLLEEIKKATGMDLKIPEKGKKKKKKEANKFPGLTDIKAKQNNAYTRLAKKVFNKGAVKRVAQLMDVADHKRYRDKYGDQFNYVHDTS